MTLDTAVRLACEELGRAEGLFPTFHSSHEGYAVIREELDELWEAVKRGHDLVAPEDAAHEAVQVAAMALRFLVDICGSDEDVLAYQRGRLEVRR